MAAEESFQEKLDRLNAEIEAKTGAELGASARSPEPLRPTPPGALARIRRSALLPLFILALPWSQEIVDQLVFNGRWNWVLYPRSFGSIPEIFLSAFSHAGFGHLIGNSISFTLFTWLILAKSRRDFWITFLIGWIGGGAIEWLIGPSPVHGLSGVVYSLFGYLLAIGWLEKRLVPLALSVFVLINYSYVIWGVLPTQPGVAWWGHLIGFFLGLFAAYGVYREPVRSR